MSLWFHVGSVGLGLIAAFLWACSAFVNLPIPGPAFDELRNIRPFMAAMKKIARLNASAAGFTFLSVLCQATAMWLSPFISLLNEVSVSVQ